MHHPIALIRLLPQQTRLIHASEGMRLRVVSGRLWLTQPNVAQDLFLCLGDGIDLMQDGVVIGTDAEPLGGSGAPGAQCVYELQPRVENVKPLGLFRRWVVVATRLRTRATGGLDRAVAPDASVP